MKYLLPVLVALLFTACSKTKKDNSSGVASIPYDMPPTAPIPPVNYCFKETGGKASLELHIEGDSAFGKIMYAKSENIPDGNFTGIIYGKTILTSYKFRTDSGWQKQDQQWKFSNDSIYKVRDHGDGAAVLNSYFKVPCK